MTDVSDGRTSSSTLVDLSQHVCLACGNTARWEGMHVEEDPGHNPALVVWCDCGRGELKIVVA